MTLGRLLRQASTPYAMQDLQWCRHVPSIIDQRQRKVRQRDERLWDRAITGTTARKGTTPVLERRREPVQGKEEGADGVVDSIALLGSR